MHKSKEQNIKTRNKHTHGQLTYKGGKIIYIYSVSGFGKTGASHSKQRTWTAVPQQT